MEWTGCVSMVMIFLPCTLPPRLPESWLPRTIGTNDGKLLTQLLSVFFFFLQDIYDSLELTRAFSLCIFPQPCIDRGYDVSHGPPQHQRWLFEIPPFVATPFSILAFSYRSLHIILQTIFAFFFSLTIATPINRDGRDWLACYRYAHQPPKLFPATAGGVVPGARQATPWSTWVREINFRMENGVVIP